MSQANGLPPGVHAPAEVPALALALSENPSATTLADDYAALPPEFDWDPPEWDPSAWDWAVSTGRASLFAAHHAAISDDLSEDEPGEVNREDDPDRWIELANTEPRPVRTVDTARLDATVSNLYVPGGTFILDVPDLPPAVWGQGSRVGWAEGEALMIAGGSGTGKTTLAGQLVRGRLGLATALLGLPITPGSGRVLYLAMDRPSQAARALRRQFTEEDRERLDGRLMVWKGPPPRDLARFPDTLPKMCADAGADMVVIDSLKDAAIGLSEDEVGAGWNRARQLALVNGIQVLELHHLVKRGAGGLAPDSLADVYGSTWLTSGAGSVVVLIGAAGDPIIKFRHLKPPVEEIGPWQISHDHAAGTSAIWHGTELLTLAALGPVTARGAACVVYETEKPTPAEVEKVRRRLEKLADAGGVQRSEPTIGGVKGGTATIYSSALGATESPAP